jgi:hypothetical protein
LNLPGLEDPMGFVPVGGRLSPQFASSEKDSMKALKAMIMLNGRLQEQLDAMKRKVSHR